ncbi:MAG TPA: replication factor C large subunit [Candidatus Bathyarchaeota archaeon]|nr:replication factor C large subunit [Candidatus Bathyarchaeota archaeon]
MSTTWTQKHRPQTLNEIVGNTEAKQQFLNWLKSWNKGIPKKRAALLHGPPGIGKTVTVEASAKELSMELVEKNASDYRTADAIKRFAGLASQYGTLFGGNRLILLDEMDGVSGKDDRGGVRELTNVLKTTRSPVVLTANDAYDPRFRTIRNYCLVIPFKKPTIRETVSHLKRICAKEGIEADEEALKLIAERAERDVRSAVNDLQALAQDKTHLTVEDVKWLSGRDRKEVIFDVMRTILYSGDSWKAKKAVSSADVDPDMLFNWIYENTPYHLTDPHDLVKAMDYLALADIYRKRIIDTQYWTLLRYVIDFMSSGVAVSRQRSKASGWIPFRFPEKIRMLSRTKGERALQKALGMKIWKRCHISAMRSAKEVLPYLKIIFENNPEMAVGLSDWLDLDEEMIEYLAGNKKQTKAILAKLE